MNRCHHFGCAFDCPLAPWNQQGGPMTRIQILKRWIVYIRSLLPGYSRKEEPMWIYAQSREHLWWLDPIRFAPKEQQT